MGNISSTFIRHCWPIQGNICNNLGYPTELTEFLEQILGERADKNKILGISDSISTSACHPYCYMELARIKQNKDKDKESISNKLALFYTSPYG